jgi:hypothetical protein
MKNSSSKYTKAGNGNMISNIMKSTTEQKQKISGTTNMKMGGTKKLGCGR